jgi:hypothetical protein
MMQYVSMVAITIVALGCAKHSTSETAISQAVASEDRDSQEPHFRFIAPDGFQWNSEHRIWHHKGLRTSITLSHAPGATFQTVIDDFVPARMLTLNMELTSKEIRNIDGRPTLLVHANRLKGKYPQEACAVVFGTDVGCAQLNAIYPADMNKEMKARIESALLNARYEVPTTTR